MTNSVEVVRQLARGSILSILIKAANAILAYLMLLIIARISSEEEYGVFGVAFSVAVSVAYLASLGQPRSVLRFWTQWTAQDHSEKARATLRRTLNLNTAGLSTAALVIVAGGALELALDTPWSFAVAAGTAIFALAFGCAEYASTALRAQGYIVIALAPRDIAWRILVCGVFGLAALNGSSFSAGTVVLTIGGTLLMIVAPQIVMLWRQAKAEKNLLSKEERGSISRYSAIVWVLNSADLAKNYAGVIIVSGWLGAENAGGYFAAERTSNVLSFIMLAVTLVAGPQISKHYHSGRMDMVRLIVGLVGFTAALAALSGLVVFILFGAEILALFKPAYAAYLPVLLLLCLGQLFAAASGPVGVLLLMAGFERVLLIAVGGVSIVTVILQAVGAQVWGLNGVAAATAIGVMLLSLFRIIFAARKLGIDSTGFALVARYCRDHFRMGKRKDRQN